MKRELRRDLRARRRALKPVEHAAASRRAVGKLMRLPEFAAGKRVALYLPFDAEADTLTLIDIAWQRGLRLYVPVIVDRRHRRMRFYPLRTSRCRTPRFGLTRRGLTRPGAFGIEVPLQRGAPLSPQWFNLMIIPLVGIDAGGRRLGMGGGYYDRALGFRRRRRVWRGPRLAGLAFECQRIAGPFFADRWDAGLDCLATESGLHRFLQEPR